MSNISKELILNVLRKVNDPDLHKDLVSLNMIKDIQISGDNVKVTVELTTPACPLKDKIKQDCVDAIRKDVGGIKNLEIEMGASV